MSLLADPPNVDLVNTVVACISNLVSNYGKLSEFFFLQLALTDMTPDPAVTVLNSLPSTAEGFSKLIRSSHSKLRLDLRQLLSTFLILISQESTTQHYATDILSSLCAILSQMGTALKKDHGALAVRVTLRFLAAETRFEDALVSTSRRLLLFMTLCLANVYVHKDDPDNPDLSRRCLGAVGNLSTRPGFCEVIEISTDDSIFDQIVSLFHGEYHIPEGTVPGDDTGPLKHSLYTGIACVMLGNMAQSETRLQEIVDLVPDLVPTAMNYFSGESDPFGLQGAHLIKNMTVAPNAQHCAPILQRGGASLVGKLLEFQNYPHLRVLGAQIAQNLLRYTSRLGNMEAAFDYGTIVRSLSDAFYQEDDMEVVYEIVLACDASIAELLRYESTDGDEEATEFLEAETVLSKLFLHYLHALYEKRCTFDVPVTVKASKSLGVLATSPALNTR